MGRRITVHLWLGSLALCALIHLLVNAIRTIAAQEREDLRGPLSRLLERRLVPAVVEEHEA
jgi:hypothetical protein